jgi:hypothetical protein
MEELEELEEKIVFPAGFIYGFGHQPRKALFEVLQPRCKMSLESAIACCSVSSTTIATE